MTNQQLKLDSSAPAWICCQIGAREHYAVPRSLISSDHKVKLLTDVWADPQHEWIMPQRWKQRAHPEIPADCVKSWNVFAFGLRARSALRRRSMWERILVEDEWFQQKVSHWLKQHVPQFTRPPIVFGYSYAAKRIFETATQLGCHTVLGQIDPGPVEMRLVQTLEEKHGYTRSEWPPESYWDNWRHECQLADSVVINSEWSRQAMLQEGIPGSKLQVIPLAFEKAESNPTTPIEFPNSFSEDRPLRVLFLGQVNLRKGIKELGEAIAILRGQNVHWTIVGNGDETLLAELRRLNQTTVTGPVSRKEVTEYYKNVDVFILPTHSDGFALTQLEAASYGLPIVASRFCGEVVTHDQNGITLSEVSGQVIAAAINRFIQDPSLVRRMSETQSKLSMLSIHQLGRRFTMLSESLMPSRN